MRQKGAGGFQDFANIAKDFAVVRQPAIAQSGGATPERARTHLKTTICQLKE
jgi:hypothetical protein